MSKNVLFEIGCEELPPKTLLTLCQALCDGVTSRLAKHQLNYSSVKHFAAPRRLGLFIENLDEKQQDQIVDKRGPAISHAFDNSGNPTKAAEGFAKSCNTTVDHLSRQKTDKGEWLFYQVHEPGQQTEILLPNIFSDALNDLPVNRPMRWGNLNEAFIRPVHWLLFLFGDAIVPMTLFNITSSNRTFGHRFMAPSAITISKADSQEYEEKLNQAFVMADFNKRKQVIVEKSKSINEYVVLQDALTDEVTAIVEWPEPLLAEFDEKFLQVPKEVLISSMAEHQKSFPIIKNEVIQSHFITVSNIKSRDPKQVILGNQRVMRARLSDAEFFFNNDKNTKLADRLDALKTVTYQKKLGSLYEKTLRNVFLSQEIAKILKADLIKTERAALLAKADLTSDMVGEFPELQGMMGYYYALHDKEDSDVAVAIKAHYQPAFSGDELPVNQFGSIVALADRLDMLLGIIGVKGTPGGASDPFALKRAAYGILRIIVDNRYNLDIKLLLEKLLENCYQHIVLGEDILSQVLTFIRDRQKAWYKDRGFSADVFQAVDAVNPTKVYDFELRMQAVTDFRQLAEAESLASANKRVFNILQKQQVDIDSIQLDPNFLADEKAICLYQALQAQCEILQDELNYKTILNSLAELKQPIDDFFEHVMVMVDDEKLRINRLALLAELRRQFIRVADISQLQGKA